MSIPNSFNPLGLTLGSGQVVDEITVGLMQAVTSNAVALKFNDYPTFSELNTALSYKQGNLSAGDGITLSGNSISVNANGVISYTETKPVSGQTVKAAIDEIVVGTGFAGVHTNNTFTETNTFNGAVALNGPVQGAGADDFGAALLAPLADVHWLAGVTNQDQFNYRVFGENTYAPKRNKIYGSYIVWVFPDVIAAEAIEGAAVYKTENATVIFSYPNATSGSVPMGWGRVGNASVIHARLYAPKMITAKTVCGGWTTCEIFAAALQSLTEGIAYTSTANGRTKAFTLHAPVLKTLRMGAGSVLECVHLYTPQVENIDNLFTFAPSTSTMPALVEFLLTDSSRVTTAKNAFVGCTVLPANQYPTNWSSLEHGDGMFNRCSLLDAATANAILDSLPDLSEDTEGEHAIGFVSTAAATTWLADGADLSHVQAAEAKGWTVDYGQNA